MMTATPNFLGVIKTLYAHHFLLKPFFKIFTIEKILTFALRVFSICLVLSGLTDLPKSVWVIAHSAHQSPTPLALFGLTQLCHGHLAGLSLSPRPSFSSFFIQGHILVNTWCK